MPDIRTEFDGQTVITTFEVTPGSAQDVLEMLTAAWDQVIRRQPGFIAGAVHLNDAQTRIATYSQWRDRKDYQAMLRSDEMRRRNREIHAMCKSFEPVMYEVQAVFGD
ncbi:MAG: antibiotic biosynthesis monooxygenase family protein [Paracoccus sp. (in: a-proteobacteria)]|jgi:heme-degrading monooxygenase HmoA|uniref:antibiotic biosynthesis monooxygenase family protein n=1 Tax=unclassified Paracoccus (in: a-proteobacteria) TaxID=2688777 RepID=UPI000C441C18|nr:MULTISPECIES: antibiotic biosynthesis monooxygenase family protein [unclassified Paracoccus (in: a-proteobacteria)]MAN55363.1 antibiotic biosynthesis monooxygenase [Paracoccus sp. (in: a-proteobacteria)]MBA48412.1 antibiotic biosynthesis monooxygenase [Paracoccus sp. (in: a-proteobacteria)]MCS5601253.1 antibiotic biosynthesis monooxygenase [Paracoccus sp. (in: a-proteobacteria)]HIC66868.1 antibiotic biosynthesis monooxygenase [Paracoccus sp. (in: a-proteobacteria)]|tara:strand:- start:2236 stop:2559 length:324 start_codon:yes stop_codon:yes gene_type:complete